MCISVVAVKNGGYIFSLITCKKIIMQFSLEANYSRDSMCHIHCCVNVISVILIPIYLYMDMCKKKKHRVLQPSSYV